MRTSALMVAALLVVGAGASLPSTRARADTTTTASTPTTTVANADGTPYTPPPVCVDVIVAATHAKPGVATVECRPWRRLDNWRKGPPSVMANSFAPSPQTPSVVASAAWIRTSSTDLALYPGYKGPGPSPLPRGPEMVPTSGRSLLLATFNSGFYEADEAAGFYVNHTLYFPMVRGLATVVRYSDGKVAIEDWAWGARPGPTIQMARQNLTMLVDDGAATPRSANSSLWGVTLHGAPEVWRSALGIDAQGNLVYAAAPDQTSSTMAAIMVRLHVVRAMQLDINPEWPIFVTYGASDARGATLVVPNPNQVADRFLYPSTKDFFAVFVTRHRGEAQPW